MRKRIVVTLNDYSRILGLIESSATKMKLPDTVSRLYEKLVTAEMRRQETIDERIITMNSRILLKELSSGRETEITITYPQEAEPRERKISLFSDIGTALLGRKEKDVVSCKIPSGVGLFEIVKVTYQPEAAGDYYL
jgi:regulator of nucleoside diphosphate kinase